MPTFIISIADFASTPLPPLRVVVTLDPRIWALQNIFVEFTANLVRLPVPGGEILTIRAAERYLVDRDCFRRTAKALKFLGNLHLENRLRPEKCATVIVCAHCQKRYSPVVVG